MRWRTTVAGALLVAGLAGCGGAAAGGGGDAAACAVPMVWATPAEVRAGDEVTVALPGAPSPCNDGDNSGDVPEERPLLDVPVRFAQGEGVRPAEDVRSAGTTYDGTVTVVVPADARPGRAGVHVGDVVHGWLTVLP